MPVFRARYKGTCNKCNGLVSPGEYVSWSRRSRGVIYHARCIGEPEPGQPTPVEPVEPIEPEPGPVDESTEPGTPEPGLGATALRLRKEVADLKHAMNDNRERLESYVQEQRAATVAAVEQRIKDMVPLTVNLTLPSDDDGEPKRITIDGAHACLPDLLYCIRKRRHAYLFGPPGSGKSKAAAMAADALGLRFGYASLNPQTPESRLLGFIDAGGVYRRPVFRDLFEHGGVMCIDEMDNGHPALLNTLNGMVEPGARLGAFPDGMVERHPDFVLVCTGNTAGRGGDKQFPERRQFDAAFAERFVFIHWPYDHALERALTLEQGAPADVAESWLAWVRKVRAFAEEHGIRLFATPRAAMTGALFLADSAWPARKLADRVLFKGIDADTIVRVLAHCPLPNLNPNEDEDDG